MNPTIKIILSKEFWNRRDNEVTLTFHVMLLSLIAAIVSLAISIGWSIAFILLAFILVYIEADNYMHKG